MKFINDHFLTSYTLIIIQMISTSVFLFHDVAEGLHMYYNTYDDDPVCSAIRSLRLSPYFSFILKYNN